VPAITAKEKWTNYCIDVKLNANIQDLYSPLRMIGQNLKKGFCLLFNNRPDYLTPDRKTFSVTNSTDFTSLLVEYGQNNTHSEGPFNTDLNGIPELYDKNDIIPMADFRGYNVTI
jgi:hypothetical protein